MPLIGPDSAVSDHALRDMLVEHLDGIRQMGELLEAPTRRVTDPSRIAMARSLAGNFLTFVGSPAAAALDREALRLRVNLSYELMLVLIDYAKTYTEGPRVPGARPVPKRRDGRSRSYVNSSRSKRKSPASVVRRK